jgi:quercetin dioxygenase-like cupin family protein
MSIAELIVLGPGEGKAVSVLGDRYTFKAAGRDTGGRYGLVEVTAPAGAPGPPPHIHDGEEEAIYVVEGDLRVQIAERTLQASAGAFALVPRGNRPYLLESDVARRQGAGDRIPRRIRAGVRRDGGGRAARG